MNLKTLIDNINAAEAEAKQLLADAHHGTSPVSGTLRMVLTRAQDLVAAHEKWLADNPAPKEETATDTSAAASKPLQAVIPETVAAPVQAPVAEAATAEPAAEAEHN